MMHKNRVYFAGCSALNAGVLLKTTARFTIFDYMYRVLRDPESSPDTPLAGTRLLLAGALTGFAESMLIIPFENVKTIMIENSLIVSERAQNPSKEEAKNIKTNNLRATFHKSTLKISAREKAFYHYEKVPSTTLFSTVKEIYNTRGVRGFIQGTIPTIFRQVGNSVVRFTTYTTLKQLVSPTKPLDEYRAFALGFVSSCAVVIITQPIDIIKTRMQSKYAWQHYRNALNCAYRIFVEEGFRSYWKGWAPRLMKVGLSGGISFGIYQYVETAINTMKYEGYSKNNRF